MIRLRVRSLRVHHVGPIDMEIDASECICLSGPSGVGKTLILRSIADLEPHEGSVYLDNAKTFEMTPSDWRRKVGMLPAESQWWHETVQLHFKTVNDMWLETLGLDKEIMQWEVSRLSSGEKQRLALLRLLCNRPKVLLLDEPTSNLDPGNIGKAERLLAEYREQQKSAVIWVTHDPDQARRVSCRQYILLDGKLTPQ